jgi:hypothetical protein
LRAGGVGNAFTLFFQVADHDQKISQGRCPLKAGLNFCRQFGQRQRAFGERLEQPKAPGRDDGRRFHHRHINIEHGELG